ncbi:putative transposase [Oscillibacter valericigenes Sjm18-20]|nr:putative transposase [Oscillibacter valericigenes Sjm18-20]
MPEKQTTENPLSRPKVKHVFGMVMGLFRHRKARYRGLRRQTAKLNILFALAILILPVGLIQCADAFKRDPVLRHDSRNPA